MNNTNLLIIDGSPDNAQHINSFLRNAGKAVHVACVDNLKEFEDSLKELSPFLIVVGNQLPSSLKITQVLQIAELHLIPVVLQLSPDNTKLLETALSTHAVQVMNAEEHDQLTVLVEQHMTGGKSAHEFDSVRQKLDELRHRYDLLLDSSRDAIAYIHEGLHIYANRAYLEMLQLEEGQEIEGISLLELVTTDDDSSLKKLLRDMNEDKFSKETLAVSINTPAGKQLKANLKFSPARFNNEQCIQMVVHERDANQVLQDELSRLRKTDQLTQMWNRDTFTEALSAYIDGEKDEDSRSAVFYIEPDGMAELQQQLGLQNIDTCILDLANFIRGCIEDSDITSRFSDHGFAVLIRRKDKAALEEVANCMISNYNSHIIDLGDKTIAAACSVGITMLGSLTNDSEEVIAQAQKAFNEATQEGNTLATYKPAFTTVSSGDSERDWVERIRHALNNHDFYTVQQSIVDLEGENEGLFENRTFMREDESDVQASEFMQAAERNDLGGAIDRHVIPQLLAAIAGTGDRHIIAISNNSATDFSFLSWFKRSIEETEVEGSQIILQISSISAESNLKATARIINDVKELGCGVVLSEFDNDRRTIQWLEHLPVNMIKLRPGLAQGLSANTANQETIRAVVDAVREYNIVIVADEVQDASDLAILWQCGVKLVTGDFLNEAPQVVGQ